MADSDTVTVGLVVAVVAFSILGLFETRILRKKMKSRRIRSPKGDSDLPDEAHNAIVTSKAILSSLERQGVHSPEVSGWLREAEAAESRGNYRVALDLTRKSKERLLSLKAAQTAKGDLAKLEQLSVAGSGIEVTTKELLQKEIPPNFLQSRFSIEMAGTAVEQARLAGRDVGQATQLLEAAQGRFDAKDYDAALKIARQSTRAAGGEKIEVPVQNITPASVPPVGRPCPSCGAALAADDVFCRKCGTRLAPSTCASCGTSLLPDDSFCRKCGAAISR